MRPARSGARLQRRSALTIDTTAPTAPSITSDVIVNTNEVALTGAAEANSTVNLYDGAILLGSATANGSGAWSYTTAGLGNGTHNLTATATDAAGNAGAASTVAAITLNTPIPTAPVIASFSPDTGIVGDGITNVNVLTLTGTAIANSTISLYDGATLLGTALASGSGDWSFHHRAIAATAATAYGDGRVAGYDQRGTVDRYRALGVTIDTTAPVAPAITSFSTDSGTVGDHITNDNTPTLTGTAEANSTVKVYDGATLLGSAAANGSGGWTYTTAALTDGAHNLTITDPMRPGRIPVRSAGAHQNATDADTGQKEKGHRPTSMASNEPLSV